MTDLSKFNVTAADWRKQIQRNETRTFWVIALFVALYLAIGLLVDVYVYSHRFLTMSYSQYYFVNPRVILINLLTLRLIPYATLIMGAIAAISLFITYSLYDKIMLLGTEYHEVTPENAQSLEERQLYNVVEEMKVASGLGFMPRVFIIEADYMNAFASGYSEKSAMVAITRGLMQKLDRNELQAVMAHELSHVRHADIKLILTASILSNLLLIAVDLIFRSFIFGRNRRADERLMLVVVLLRFILPITTILLMMYLSRTREYMADAGCVELMRDNQSLASALLKIHNDYSNGKEDYRNTYGHIAHEEVRRAAYFYDPAQAGFLSMGSINQLFSTHPDIRDRLAALGVKLQD